MASSSSRLEIKHEQPPSKRPRANTAGDAHETIKTQGTLIPEYDLTTACDRLDRSTLIKLLTEGAKSDAKLALNLRQSYHELLQKDSARAIDIDHLSKKVWKEINITHSSKSGSRQFDAASDVCWDVQEAIGQIQSQIFKHSPYATKRSGLETLRKIGKTICLSGTDTLGHEVQKQFQWGKDLEDAFFHIVDNTLTDEERIRPFKDPIFVQKLEELRELSMDHDLFKGLDVDFEELAYKANNIGGHNRLILLDSTTDD